TLADHTRLLQRNQPIGDIEMLAAFGALFAYSIAERTQTGLSRSNVFLAPVPVSDRWFYLRR
ncbi:MAG: hypothetical protein AAFN79_21280, partial [Pseudomonadota bacterium]